MMGRQGVVSMAGLLVLFALASTRTTMATDYTVGDSMGWTGPPNITEGFYNDWAAGKTFEGGDSLKFVWNGSHNVAIVSKEDYENCTKVSSYFIGGSAFTYTLPSNASGMYYFICTVDSHCEGGQKLAINVTSSEPSTTDDGSSAPLLAIGALSSAVLPAGVLLLHLLN
ncbi:hypothetical protein CRG98_000066 [Punica granatum]|uniref:Phytocyanin domain-containing protein n=2 Tax=Punica granatum TaxID=22663 RepID=A0A2I0LFY4_PUNGR|nr:hypothetical protein CRG98_000066 [Punica granatum]